MMTDENPCAIPELPKAISRLPKAKRALWIEVFEDNYDPDCPKPAYKAAWAAVRADDRQRRGKMTGKNVAEVAEWLHANPTAEGGASAEKADAGKREADHKAQAARAGNGHIQPIEGGATVSRGKKLAEPVVETVEEKKYDAANPPDKIKGLPKHAQDIWIAAFNSAWKKYPKDEARCNKIAWGAVKNAGYYQDADGKWHAPKKEKSTDLFDRIGSVIRAFYQEFDPGRLNGEWSDTGYDVARTFDDLLIVSKWDKDENSMWKVPYTVTLKAVAGDPLGQEQVESVEFAAQDQWVQVMPTFTQLKTLAQADGKIRWLLVSSGSFEDRDHEVVSTDFLESCVKAAQESQERGPLLIHHVPGSNIGTCDMQIVTGGDGEPGFLVESGTFDDTGDGKRAAAYYEEHAKEYGASIKFVYVTRTADGVYLPPGTIIERSMLPRAKAAFPWSAIQLQEVEKMGASKEAREELARVLGDERADEILAQLEHNSESLKEAGVRWKEAQSAAQEQEPEPAAEPPADSTEEGAAPDPEQMDAEPVDGEGEPVPEPVEALEVVLPEEVLVDLASKATALAMQNEGIVGVLAQAKNIQETKDQLDALRTAVQEMSAAIKELQSAEDERIAKKVRELPRASVTRIQRPTQATSTQNSSQTTQDGKESLVKVGLQTLYPEK